MKDDNKISIEEWESMTSENILQSISKAVEVLEDRYMQEEMSKDEQKIMLITAVDMLKILFIRLYVARGVEE